MTNTVIYNGVTLGTTAEQTTAQPTKTVMQVGTIKVVLNVEINLNGSVIEPSDEVRLYYAIHPTAFTADSTLPSSLIGQYEYLSIRLGGNRAKVCKSTGLRYFELLANNGGNLYTWYDCPALQRLSPGVGTAPTITLTSVELA